MNVVKRRDTGRKSTLVSLSAYDKDVAVFYNPIMWSEHDSSAVLRARKPFNISCFIDYSKHKV